MIKVAVIGYGNIGKAVLEAIKHSEDITAVGIVSRSLPEGGTDGVRVVRDISELGKVDVAILSTPSRAVPDLAEKLLLSGINTVDSYDIHSSIADVRKRLDKAAKSGGCASVLSAGWDPGSDSVIRALLEAMMPRGLTYTNFGPGMSMGHTVAVKAIKGVKNAFSLTVPKGSGIHRRMVYIETEDGADFNAVSEAIKNDAYFVHDETHVIKVDSVEALKDVGHGAEIVRKGVSGDTHNQNARFTMSINNPALTGQILVSSARAVVKQAPGCYTMIEIAPIHFLEGDAEEIVRRLV
ncbi:MAG: diaminopimelate dehydrogenase [Eubacteriales bacterium]|nr:diaminopimelate dehydrogenase [Eubacteriales bacterium]MDD4474830.1 diaminopimelate dehydrogenase [Eubacteriales bacterium]